MAGSITAVLADSRSSLAVYKAAGSSVQLQKAARSLQNHISQLTGFEKGPSQKLAANFFIETFAAAFGSLQVGIDLHRIPPSHKMHVQGNYRD
jgi:hypothetical protein